ncbi:MAG: DNA-binding transcriptional LysR family regulator [Lentimonas sp.]
MDKSETFKTVNEVARLGSFSRAAEKLNRSTSSVSRQVSEFEQWIGVPIFQRTTRQVSLTNAGEFFIDRLQDIVLDIESLREDAATLVETVRGRLRITSALFYTQRCITPHLKGFLEKYPELQLEFELSHTTTNIIGEGIDLAIRIGRLSDSSLISRKIGDVRLLLTASPEFLARYGMPKEPLDLTELPCLVDTVPAYGKNWPIGGKTRVSAVIEANNGEMIRDLTLQGLGISFLPDFFVADDLESGKLVQILAEFEPDKVGVYAVYPPRHQVSSSARVFVDWLVSMQK